MAVLARSRGAKLAVALLSLAIAFPAQSIGAAAPRVSVDARPGLGILSAGVRVTDPKRPKADLTLQNGVKLWFAVQANPSSLVAPSQGPSLARFLSQLYLLAPNANVTFAGTFPEPSSRVTLTVTLNSPDAALLNLAQVLVTAALAMVPGTTQINPRSLVAVLQDFKAVQAVSEAALAFVPPPRTAAGWTKATAKAAYSLQTVLKDNKQAVLLVKAFGKLGIEVSTTDLKRILKLEDLRGLLSLVADTAVFIYVTKGREPYIVFERSPDDTEAHVPPEGSVERKAILDALRIVLERELRQSLILRVERYPRASPDECQRYPDVCKFHNGQERFRVKGDWAFVEVRALRPDGRLPDYRATRHRARYEFGGLDDVSPALLRRTNGRWAVVIFSVGPTDVVYIDWCRKYGAPGSIFPYDHGRGCPG